ncbi:hypothetical protein [Lacimicrobium alkaliphilum]|uniref:STAS/SEC14 domain-containing protein n=1 Tax=Lacimicrobium alkaliphilum TaxID=1526571 RepID=A0ABQ1QYY8_9ALTE|nr:hypothetical protein [Lacimicrobium alkaliphilum]GGD48968.1 hypothetical protein GCM10011357_01200 [Lacimicrobium alkaliphilum]
MTDYHRIHGSIRIELEGRILILHAEGPGNAELVQQYQQDVKHYRDQLRGKPWGNLVVFYNEPLLTPEGKELMYESIRRSRESGMVAVAMVLSQANSPSIVRQFWEGIYTKVGMPHVFFDSQDEARNWLETLL